MSHIIYSGGNYAPDQLRALLEGSVRVGETDELHSALIVAVRMIDNLKSRLTLLEREVELHQHPASQSNMTPLH